MLPDPLMVSTTALADLSTHGDNAHSNVNPFRVTDLSPSGTVRVGTFSGNPATITIRKSESGENKGTVTDRIAVKFSNRKVDSLIGSVSASVQLTFALPRVQFSPADLKAMLVTLLSPLFYLNDGTRSDEIIDRLLAGEP